MGSEPQRRGHCLFCRRRSARENSPEKNVIPWAASRMYVVCRARLRTNSVEGREWSPEWIRLSNVEENMGGTWSTVPSEVWYDVYEDELVRSYLY